MAVEEQEGVSKPVETGVLPGSKSESESEARSKKDSISHVAWNKKRSMREGLRPWGGPVREADLTFSLIASG